jgi:protein associated with RNAse G/E
MQAIRIVSRKYDGRLRDEYEAFLYAEDDERLLVYAPVGTMSFDRHTQAWAPAPDGLLEIYFKHRWYNVWHICEQLSNISQIYCNLSLPAIRTAEGIEWIDLDLDYRVHMDGRIERLDEDEYRVHIASMGYTADVQVQAACAEIEALYQQRADPFNHAAQVALYHSIKAQAAWYGLAPMPGGCSSWSARSMWSSAARSTMSSCAASR